MYLGFVELEDTLHASHLTKSQAGVPKDASAAPIFRIYGANGVLKTGSMALKDSTNITGAANTAPIAITANNHKLSTGQRVTVAGVGGNTAANGDWNITVTGANTFTLDGSTGNGTYTTGGTVHVAGLYDMPVNPRAVDGFDSGENYSVHVTDTTDSVTRPTQYTFSVT